MFTRPYWGVGGGMCPKETHRGQSHRGQSHNMSVKFLYPKKSQTKLQNPKSPKKIHKGEKELRGHTFLCQKTGGVSNTLSDLSQQTIIFQKIEFLPLHVNLLSLPPI